MEKVIDPKEDRRIANEPKNNIPGWGYDADPENEPTYPMKHYNGADHERLNYQRPAQQQTNIEVFKSIERPTISRVFGTSTPPKGLSGMIRRYAYSRFSESTYSHWVPLVLADRIDVVQGIIDDLKKGQIPNIFAEKGWKSEWKYNRKGLIQKIAAYTILTTAVVMMLSGKKKSFV